MIERDPLRDEIADAVSSVFDNQTDNKEVERVVALFGFLAADVLLERFDIRPYPSALS